MKIGILTYHRSHNYGAYIQAYALASSIKENTGYDVEIIDYNSPVSEKFYRRELFRDKNFNSIVFNIKKYKMFKEALNQLPLSKELLITTDLEKIRIFLRNKYDVIVVGSDEIWKLDGERGFPNAYWLPGVDNCIKMAYAASSRSQIEKVSEDDKEKINDLLSSFRFVGVRDKVTLELIQRSCKECKPVLVCDPTMAYTFCFDRVRGKRILFERFGVDTNKKCIGVMVNKKSLAKEIIKHSDWKCEYISLFYQYDGYKVCANLTPFEWVDVISALDGLITTFFHGMCIAINANIPFVVIEERNIVEAAYSKSYDLLARNALEKHYLQANLEENIGLKMSEFITSVKNGTADNDFTKTKENEQRTFTRFCEALCEVKEA